MDADRFDTLARSLTAVRSRRGLTRILFGLAFGSAAAASPRVEAKKNKPCPPCKKRKQGKCKKKLPDGSACRGGTCHGGRCTTCSDGVKNGNETSIDCGGTCPRCPNGRTCASRNDCDAALCTGGMCAECVLNSECGTDVNGQCYCDPPASGGPWICVTDQQSGPPVSDCTLCPADTVCFGTAPAYTCFKRCGAA